MRYCCPNPNCNRVFSKPKIIRYYVCPTCQSPIRLNDSHVHSHMILQKRIEKTLKVKKIENHDDLKQLEPTLYLLSVQSDKKTDLALIQSVNKTILALIPTYKKTDLVLIQDQKKNEPITFQNPVENKRYQIETEKVENDCLTINSEPILNTTVSKKANETVANPDSSNKKCSHYFGYLYERTKGEKIPEACFECSKLVPCMMSESDDQVCIRN